MPTILSPERSVALTVRREGSKVLLLVNGKALPEMSWEKADELCSAIRGKARAAEEFAKAEQVAMDAAILFRAGFPIGLTSDRKIRAEARKLAAWDSALRRYMPGGIKSAEQVGRPGLTVHAPDKEGS